MGGKSYGEPLRLTNNGDHHVFMTAPAKLRDNTPLTGTDPTTLSRHFSTSPELNGIYTARSFGLNLGKYPVFPGTGSLQRLYPFRGIDERGYEA
jgi:hypothetical protein